MSDEKMIVIRAQFPDEFADKVNELLEAGGWRVAQTEVSVTDHHYYALLIKAKAEGK